MQMRVLIRTIMLWVHVYLLPGYCVGQRAYDVRTISIQYPEERRINLTQKQFIDCIRRAGLQCVYDSAYHGTTYYDTSSLAPVKRIEKHGYTEHFWRVKNYHHGTDTIPEITFMLSGRWERFCVIEGAAGHSFRPDQTNISAEYKQVVTPLETSVYLEKVNKYTNVVRRYFKKDMCKQMKQ